jgi:anaerobic ribonucleoside-triphosphate reductase activating protein
MKIRLASDLQTGSIVDGVGIRAVIWTQGCSHNCPFCQNPQTHDFNGGEEWTVEEIKRELDELNNQDGITFSGGDPLFQIEPVFEIAKHAKKLNLNVWCYTGWTYEEVLKLGKKNPKYLEFLNYIDVLVDGKFENDIKDLNLSFRGSSNQRLIDMKKTLACGEIVLFDEYSYNEEEVFKRKPMFV